MVLTQLAGAEKVPVEPAGLELTTQVQLGVVADDTEVGNVTVVPAVTVDAAGQPTVTGVLRTVISVLQLAVVPTTSAT